MGGRGPVARIHSTEARGLADNSKRYFGGGVHASPANSVGFLPPERDALLDGPTASPSPFTAVPQSSVGTRIVSTHAASPAFTMGQRLTDMSNPAARAAQSQGSWSGAQPFDYPEARLYTNDVAGSRGGTGTTGVGRAFTGSLGGSASFEGGQSQSEGEGFDGFEGQGGGLGKQFGSIESSTLVPTGTGEGMGSTLGTVLGHSSQRPHEFDRPPRATVSE